MLNNYIKSSYVKNITIGCMFSVLIGYSTFVSANDPSIKVDYAPWSKFAENIENCKPGTFSLPDPFEIKFLEKSLKMASEDDNALKVTQNEINEYLKQASISYQISGKQQEQCMLVINKSLKMSESKPQNFQIECAVNVDDLKTLSQAARNIASGKSNESLGDPLANIMTKSCK